LGDGEVRIRKEKGRKDNPEMRTIAGHNGTSAVKHRRYGRGVPKFNLGTRGRLRQRATTE